jgi:predicted O-methyltransferase YrrM
MDLDAFSAKLRDLFAGDPQAGNPVDPRFAAVVDDVPGMATESKLALLNLAAAQLGEGEAYLEVGSFKGLSLIGAMLDNPGRRFYAMENFLEFNLDGRALREELLANLGRWVELDRLQLLEGDCFELLRRPGILPEPVGVYFYDGAHGRLPHYLALAVAEPWLADRALVVVDDASWPMVARATDRYLRAHPGYRLLFDLAAAHEEDPVWWNGVRLYGFEHRPAAVGPRRPGRGRVAGGPDRPSFDVAWRLLAYDLVYRPAVRVAWRTLPRHPRLCSAVLKVVPTSSRRVVGAPEPGGEPAR